MPVTKIKIMFYHIQFKSNQVFPFVREIWITSRWSNICGCNVMVDISGWDPASGPQPEQWPSLCLHRCSAHWVIPAVCLLLQILAFAVSWISIRIQNHHIKKEMRLSFLIEWWNIFKAEVIEASLVEWKVTLWHDNAELHSVTNTPYNPLPFNPLQLLYKNLYCIRTAVGSQG